MNADGSDRNVVFQSRPANFRRCRFVQTASTRCLSMPNKQTKAINIYRLDVAGGKTDIVTNGKFDQNPACSPDSKFFVYTTLVNGKNVADANAARRAVKRKQLSDDYVEFGRISPDGQQIADARHRGQWSADQVAHQDHSCRWRRSHQDRRAHSADFRLLPVLGRREVAFTIPSRKKACRTWSGSRSTVERRRP